MRYGAGPEVLHDIELDLEPGGFFFLTGPSGRLAGGSRCSIATSQA